MLKTSPFQLSNPYVLLAPEESLNWKKTSSHVLRNIVSTTLQDLTTCLYLKIFRRFQVKGQDNLQNTTVNKFSYIAEDIF